MSEFEPDIPPETNWFEENGEPYPEPMIYDRRNDQCLGTWIEATLFVLRNPDMFSEQYVAGKQYQLDRMRGVHGRRFKRIKKSLE